jgi:hypothetical protein
MFQMFQKENSALLKQQVPVFSSKIDFLILNYCNAILIQFENCFWGRGKGIKRKACVLLIWIFD